MTVGLGTIPQKRASVDTSLSNQTTKDLETTRVAFFAGDDIGSIEKYEMPNVKGFGGLYFPQIKTLPKENKGMLYRCQFTPLRPSKITQPKVMLAPGDRDNWESGFIQGDKVINGFLQSNQVKINDTGEFATRRDDHMVYKTRYPGHDILEITKRSEPHGAGGVVEVAALKGATQDEIDAAQFFFFPNWNEISAGIAFLPDTHLALEEHIRMRIRAIATECPIELRPKYSMIGQSMIQSCTEFRRHYLTTFQKNEIIMKDAAAKGNTGASYHPRTEDAMRLLEYRRKDDIVSGDSSSVDRLARIMEQKELGNNNLEAQKIELELLKERNRAKELELQAAGVTPKVITVRKPITPDEDMTEVVQEAFQEAFGTDTATRICGKPTAFGTPCERTLKENETHCFQHSK